VVLFNLFFVCELGRGVPVRGFIFSLLFEEGFGGGGGWGGNFFVLFWYFLGPGGSPLLGFLGFRGGKWGGLSTSCLGGTVGDRGGEFVTSFVGPGWF